MHGNVSLNVLFGSYISRVRRRNKVQQTKLGDILNLDQSAMSRVESGKQTLTAIQWFTFCDYFQLPTEMLSAIEEEKLLNEVEDALGGEIKIHGFKSRDHLFSELKKVALNTAKRRKRYNHWLKHQKTIEALRELIEQQPKENVDG